MITTLSSSEIVPSCDLVVAFGTSCTWRKERGTVLLHSVRKQNLADLYAFLWRFMNSQNLLLKLKKPLLKRLRALGIDASELEEHDYLIGWRDKGMPGAVS